MRCYRCNGVLSNNNFCNSCGADVTVYKKVVKLSNAYYNMGLAKAQIRDLTGAVELLRRSVKFDKKNINARNLLGLVYFEMGEAVQALSEWVISKNIQPDKNMADEYMKRLQSSQAKLDTINQTIKKYNIALNYAKQGNDDLAVIQLKKVLNVNPNLIKGHLLLALLYMKKGDYDRAKKPVMKTLKIDSNNPLAKKYLEEIKKNTEDRNSDILKEYKKNNSGDKTEILKKQESTYDIPIPKRRKVYGESNAGMMTVINVIIGIVVGVAMTFFLLIPAKEKSMNDDHNKDVLKLNSQIEILNNEKRELENTIENLENEKNDLNGKLDSTGSENSQILSDYDNLIAAVSYFNSKDYMNCADSLGKIQNSQRSEIFTNLYNSIQQEAYNQAAKLYYDEGIKYYAASDIENLQKGIDNLTKCFDYNFKSINYVDAAEKLGAAYEKQYTLALAQNIELAGEYKDKALENMTNMINKLTADESVDKKAAEHLQVHINAIMAK